MKHRLIIKIRKSMLYPLFDRIFHILLLVLFQLFKQIQIKASKITIMNKKSLLPCFSQCYALKLVNIQTAYSIN